MRKILEIGGVVAAAVLIAFGIAAVVMGFDGRSTVASNIKAEYITGSPDMTPKGITPEVATVKAEQVKIASQFKKEGIDFQATPVAAPGCSVAGQLVDTANEARCFAQYMRIHALGSTNGLVYSQMGRYVAQEGAPLKFTDGVGGTSIVQYAQIDPKTQQPVSNGRRDLWVTETALSTALNAGYMADQISIFGIVVGFALLLAGIGFGILAVGGALRSPEGAFFARKWFRKDKGAEAVPTA